MVDKKGLLIHWWHYYGKSLYTLAELEQFEKNIDEYGEGKVLEVAVASFMCNDGSPTVILYSIRNNTVAQLFENLPKIERMSEVQKEYYNKIKEHFVQTISSTCK